MQGSTTGCGRLRRTSNPSRSSAPSGVNRESAPVDKGCSVPDLDADALIHAIPALVLDDLISTPSLEAVCVVPRQDCVRRMPNGGKKWLVYCQIGLTMLSCVLGGTLIYGWAAYTNRCSRPTTFTHRSAATLHHHCISLIYQ